MECSRGKAVEILGQQLPGLEEAICAAEAELQVGLDISILILIMVRQLAKCSGRGHAQQCRGQAPDVRT